MQTVGLLLMAYGTPNHPDEIEPYYTHIRGGRPPTPELLAELKERYATIGGRSPLNEITQAQAEGLAALLNAPAGGAATGVAAAGGEVAGGAGAPSGEPLRIRAYVGMKHWHPYIGAVVPTMMADGIRRAVGLTLTPQYSSMSVGTYIGAVEKALAQVGPEQRIAFTYVKSWHRHPRFVAVLSDRVTQALTRFAAAERPAVPVVFTAHSLPQAIVDKGDPYPQHLHETAAAVAEHLGLREWHVAYQSAGRTAVPWLGPDVRDVIADLARDGHRTCLVCPAGFVADHLEILYDIDVECVALARELGMHLERTASFNAAADFLGVLAAVVREHLIEEQSGER